MRDFVVEFYTHTTADDQRDYFFGDDQQQPALLVRDSSSLPQGTYRVVDGALHRVISGLAVEDVRKRLRKAVEETR